MRRLLVAGLFGALALPGGAAAAPLNELPFVALPDREAAGCLRPTGASGGLALFAQPAATDLWQAAASGLSRGEGARLGRLAQCAAAAQAGDHAVVAGVVRGGELRVAIRDGAGFSAPADLGAGPNPQDVVAAVSPGGHAAVAWLERRGKVSDLRQRVRVVVARRLPGQGFAAAEPLTPWSTTDVFERQRPGVGIDAGGTTTVVWSREGSRQRVAVAHAAPGAAFAVQRLGESANIGLAPAVLAVAPDGWSLVVRDADVGIMLFERAPGAARFSRVSVPLRSDAYDEVEDPAVAVGDGGGAVVAWRTDLANGGGVAAITRAPGGSFGLPETVAATRPRSGSLISASVGSGPPVDPDADRLRAAVGPGGRALLAWTVGRHPFSPSRARVAAGPLAGSFDPAQAVSSPLRDAETPAPLFLADGRAAVAWLDNASFRHDDGRLHLAVEGAPAPAASAPVAGLRARRRQRLFRSQPLTVTARCDRPCDVQAKLRGTRTNVSATLLAAGSVELRLPSARSGPRTVDLRASEPGGLSLTRRSLRIRVVRRPPLPLWPPLDVRADRRGDRIVVRWRTAGPARRMYFVLLGQRTRSERSIDFSATGYLNGRGRERFSARLRPDRPRRVRWVLVRAGSLDRGGAHDVLVPVR